MTYPTAPTPPVSPDKVVAPRQRSKWPRRVGIGAAIVVALGAGIGIGAASNSQQSQLNAANATISQQRQTIGNLQGTVGSLRNQLNTNSQQLAAAQSQANHAVAAAEAKVKVQDAAEQAKLNSEAATLKQQQQQLAQLTGMTQSNQISQDGVYVIGRDMKGGTWHTSGGGQCYYALLGSTDTSNIIDNNNITGPATVDLSNAYAFDISGGCTWVKIG